MSQPERYLKVIQWLLNNINPEISDLKKIIYRICESVDPSISPLSFTLPTTLTEVLLHVEEVEATINIVCIKLVPNSKPRETPMNFVSVPNESFEMQFARLLPRIDASLTSIEEIIHEINNNVTRIKLEEATPLIGQQTALQRQVRFIDKAKRVKLNLNLIEDKLLNPIIIQSTPSPEPIQFLYSPPPWSIPPITPYYFEVIEKGILIERIKLDIKGHLLIGRLPLCDIIIEEPTCSRQHAILQFRLGDPNEIGVRVDEIYIYDLGSTSGTYVNQIPLTPLSYYPLISGDIIQFGQLQSQFLLYQGALAGMGGGGGGMGISSSSSIPKSSSSNHIVGKLNYQPQQPIATSLPLSVNYSANQQQNYHHQNNYAINQFQTIRSTSNLANAYLQANTPIQTPSFTPQINVSNSAIVPMSTTNLIHGNSFIHPNTISGVSPQINIVNNHHNNNGIIGLDHLIANDPFNLMNENDYLVSDRNFMLENSIPRSNHQTNQQVHQQQQVHHHQQAHQTKSPLTGYNLGRKASFTSTQPVSVQPLPSNVYSINTSKSIGSSDNNTKINIDDVFGDENDKNNSNNNNNYNLNNKNIDKMTTSEYKQITQTISIIKTNSNADDKKENINNNHININNNNTNNNNNNNSPINFGNVLNNNANLNNNNNNNNNNFNNNFNINNNNSKVVVNPPDSSPKKTQSAEAIQQKKKELPISPGMNPKSIEFDQEAYKRKMIEDYERQQAENAEILRKKKEREMLGLPPIVEIPFVPERAKKPSVVAPKKTKKKWWKTK